MVEYRITDKGQQLVESVICHQIWMKNRQKASELSIAKSEE
jgi:hypothetical protein